MRNLRKREKMALKVYIYSIILTKYSGTVKK